MGWIARDGHRQDGTHGGNGVSIGKLQHHSVSQWSARRQRPAEEGHTLFLVPLLPRRQNSSRSKSFIVLGVERGERWLKYGQRKMEEVDARLEVVA